VEAVEHFLFLLPASFFKVLPLPQKFNHFRFHKNLTASTCMIECFVFICSLLDNLKCKMTYANSAVHGIGFSKYCEINLNCTEIAEPPSHSLQLVQCLKRCRGMKKKKKRCYKSKAFFYSIPIVTKAGVNLSYRLPVTCHCTETS